MTIFKNKINRILLYVLIALSLLLIGGSGTEYEPDVIIQQVPLEGNNASTWVYNTGIFNQDLRVSNTPGFQWPAGSNKFVTFTTGLSIAAFVNGELREAMASYKGELAPGYVIDSAGIPKAKVDSRFKFYIVKRTDNWINNPDWLNWGLMIPFGAPYVDVNHSGHFEPMIDTPGVSGAEMILFICMTDGFPGEHKIGEGFGGGTYPLFAEVHLAAWSYNKPGLQDVQFLKWEIINKNTAPWNGAFFAIVCDPDLGCSDDDYIGCDTLRSLGYCYNGDNDDNCGSYSYGPNPPAVGFDLLRSPVNKYLNPPKVLNMTSFNYFSHTSTSGPVCEKDVNAEPGPAYQYMRGFKKDGTPWVIPHTTPPQVTKLCYSGDPETNTGWTESTGSVQNCGSLYGNTLEVNPVGDRRFTLSSGADNLTVNPGDTQHVFIAQFVARGTSNLNSVTRLKQLDDSIQAFVNNYFPIGINQISGNIPNGFSLYQNYPNPFNPVTKIMFSLPAVGQRHAFDVRLIIYDVLGKEVAVLINQEYKASSYEVDWDASNYPSGVYLYRLTAGNFTLTKKMVLLK